MASPNSKRGLEKGTSFSGYVEVFLAMRFSAISGIVYTSSHDMFGNFSYLSWIWLRIFWEST